MVQDKLRMEKGKTVLITGASGGIGLELTKMFSENEYDLVLVARSKDKLEALSKKLKTKATVISLDLSKQDSAEELVSELKKRKLEIDILVNNAGFGSAGEFSEMNEETIIQMMNLNMNTLTILTRKLLPQLIKRKGKILNVASTAAFQPGPYMTVYYATKAYVLSFSEALNEELKGKVVVSALCPGATKTGFAKRAGVAGKLIFKNTMNSQEVALKAYSGLMKEKRIIVTGFKNKVMVCLTKFMPTSIVLKVVKKIQSWTNASFPLSIHTNKEKI